VRPPAAAAASRCVALPGAVRGAGEPVDYAVLAPGTWIGVHRVRRQREIYLRVVGSRRMHLDGREFAVGPGNVVVNRPGGQHGLENTGRAALRLFVVEVALARRAPRSAK
jgi:mannose-6-phosphate isomerase-like protein (cupin superfamily)